MLFSILDKTKNSSAHENQEKPSLLALSPAKEFSKSIGLLLALNSLVFYRYWDLCFCFCGQKQFKKKKKKKKKKALENIPNMA